MSAFWVLAAATTTVAPTVELVTMGPGEALYGLWGHAALRVVDPARARDVTFNFGSIDLSEGFFLRMLEGEVNAFVSVWPYPRTLDTYLAEDRTFERRILRLPPTAARSLVRSLDRIVQSGRGTYRYHHFDNNCSTQVAAVIDDAMGGMLRAAHAEPVDRTFRKEALALIRGRPLLYLAVDIVLTAAADRPVRAWQLAFLPEHLAHLLDDTKVEGQPLVTRRSLEYRSGRHRRPAEGLSPWWWAFLFFALPVMVLSSGRPRVALAIFAAAQGMVGVLLALLELGTRYDFLTRNLNLLVFLPTYGVISGLALSHRRWCQRIVTWHCRAAAGLLGITLIATASGASAQSVYPVLLVATGPVLLFAWQRR